MSWKKYYWSSVVSSQVTLGLLKVLSEFMRWEGAWCEYGSVLISYRRVIASTAPDRKLRVNSSGRLVPLARHHMELSDWPTGQTCTQPKWNRTDQSQSLSRACSRGGLSGVGNRQPWWPLCFHQSKVDRSTNLCGNTMMYKLSVTNPSIPYSSSCTYNDIFSFYK